MTISVLINLQTLIDPQKCYETVRQLRWTEGVTCSKCGSKHIVKRGFDETQSYANAISIRLAKLGLMI